MLSVWLSINTCFLFLFSTASSLVLLDSTGTRSFVECVSVPLSAGVVFCRKTGSFSKQILARSFGIVQETLGSYTYINAHE